MKCFIKRKIASRIYDAIDAATAKGLVLSHIELTGEELQELSKDMGPIYSAVGSFGNCGRALRDVKDLKFAGVRITVEGAKK